MKRLNYLLISALLVLVDCAPSEEKQKQDNAEQAKKEKLAYEKAFKVAVMPTMDCLPIYLLKDSILFDSTKIDIRLKQYNAQMDCDTAIINGRVQASVTDLFRAERLKRRYHAPITYLTETNAKWQLIANKKSKLTKLSDLSDKMIAMTRFSVTDYLTNKVVKDGKLKFQAYKVQVNDVLVRLKMLENDELDALWFTEPQAAQARVWGNNVLYDSKEDAFIPGTIVFVGAPSITEQQEFQNAYNKAADLINKNGVQYYSALIMKYMKVDETVVKSLPKLEYKKATQPRPADINKARYN